MIIGMLLKNFKTYYGLKYIPIAHKYKYTSYIGENGIGKSSILEALDTYFNNRIWNINNESKTRGRTGTNIPHIVVFFLLHRDKFLQKDKKDKENFDISKQLSDFFWNLNINDYKSSEEAQKLINHINELKKYYNPNDYLIIAGGIQYEHGDEIFFSSFQNKIINYLTKETEDNKEKDNTLANKLKSFNNYIKKHFSYIYIPVEVDVEKFTKLETDDMQKLMGKDIREEIKNAITNKSLNTINRNLNNFIGEISDNLKTYFYKNKSGRTNISMNELVDKVIELFFSIRTLHKKNQGGKYPPIPAEQLSSGEKKQAIIEVAESFINMQNDFDKEIILAIDEPESSLNISKKFYQFEKLFKLSERQIQILVTTHWYGFLPIINKGNLYYLHTEKKDGKKEIKLFHFDLFNYREKIKQDRQNNIKIPQEIELKSINDLIQSIISSLKADKHYNWLICEGSSEKIYFEHYFKDLIKDFNLRILPVGGYKEVKKIYEYLILPLKDKDLNNNIKGKIFCLVDTDKQLDRFETNEDKRLIKILKFRRLWNNETINRTELLRMHDDKVSPPTEIEDCLEPSLFYKTIELFEDCEIISELKENMKDEIKNSYFAFDLRDSERKKLKKWFDEDNGKRKLEFAKKYVEIANKNKNDSLTLEWINEIKNFFKGI